MFLVFPFLGLVEKYILLDKYTPSLPTGVVLYRNSEILDEYVLQAANLWMKEEDSRGL